MSKLQTEFPFTLPRGYVDPETGELHRDGVMRLATARDELAPLKDPRVRQNEAYASVIILSQVVVQLGEMEPGMITPRLIENLFAADFAYLNEVYDRINALEPQVQRASCPHCNAEFEMEAPIRLGEP